MIAMLPVSAERGDAFGKFFAREVELCKAAAATGPSYSAAFDATPMKVLTAAEAANKTSPPRWKARKTLGEADA